MNSVMEPRIEHVPSEARHRFRLTTGALTIVTDLRMDEIPESGDVFVLSCSSGRVPKQSAARTDLVFQDGCVVVYFDRLCPVSSYTLHARMVNGEDEVLFEDVAYAELTRLSEEMDESSTDPW